jgi:hypothetical protein
MARECLARSDTAVRAVRWRGVRVPRSHCLRNLENKIPPHVSQTSKCEHVTKKTPPFVTSPYNKPDLNKCGVKHTYEAKKTLCFLLYGENAR